MFIQLTKKPDKSCADCGLKYGNFTEIKSGKKPKLMILKLYIDTPVNGNCDVCEEDKQVYSISSFGGIRFIINNNFGKDSLQN